MKVRKNKKVLSAFQIIIIGFFLVILLGTVLLMLPFASQSGEAASFFDAPDFSAIAATNSALFMDKLLL